MDKPTPLPQMVEATKDLTPLNAIRTETALSRFPIHRIAKKGTVRIELKQQAKALLWKVSYNSEYGQPGPLAYKLDTLVVNRRIEEAGRPLPALIRLGSLREIADHVGADEKNTTIVRNALLQNASAFINAKITFKTTDRSERSLEAAFTRYSVIFTGETLPSGAVADAVYLVLNDPYREVLDSAVTRPLDYDYMKTLPPAAQRFYEIASYQIFGALSFQNERAKLRYSEYCLLSTATRYLDFDHVKKQMYKVHKPHLDSGYLAKVGYELTTDAEGKPDWFMYYVPGPNAAREYREFTDNARKGKKGQQQKLRENKLQTCLELSAMRFNQGSEEPPNRVDLQVRVLPDPVNSSPSMNALVEELVAADLNRDVAERYACEYPEECERQLRFVADLTDADFDSGRGAYLNRAIPGRYGPPKAYRAARKRVSDAQKAHNQRIEETTRQHTQNRRRYKIISEAMSLLANARDDSSETVAAALAAFEIYYHQERTRRMNALSSPRLKQAMEEAWASEENTRSYSLPTLPRYTLKAINNPALSPNCASGCPRTPPTSGNPCSPVRSFRVTSSRLHTLRVTSYRTSDTKSREAYGDSARVNDPLENSLDTFHRTSDDTPHDISP